MSDKKARITSWERSYQPTEQAIRQILVTEGLHPYRWSNNPLDVYSAHSHPYDKVIYVISGSISFGLPHFKDQIHLEVGDRLDLPKGILHNTVVGPNGVICLEAHSE